MCYYTLQIILIIYGGKGLEESLILSIRKFHEAVFHMLL